MRSTPKRRQAGRWGPARAGKAARRSRSVLKSTSGSESLENTAKRAKFFCEIMPYQLFKIRANDDGSETEQLNGFLRAHRILAVRNEWVAAGEDSFWAFCIDYLEPGRGKSALGGGSAQRIDYKEVLKPEEFEVFARLRHLRKDTAEKEGIPVFAIFSNEQSAEMSRRGCQTDADLREIGCDIHPIPVEPTTRRRVATTYVSRGFQPTEAQDHFLVA